MKRGRKAMPYGIKVKCKRSMTKEQIEDVERDHGTKVYGKYVSRNPAKSIYTISKRNIKKFATREAVKGCYVYSYERIAKIDPTLCW